MVCVSYSLMPMHRLEYSNFEHIKNQLLRKKHTHNPLFCKANQTIVSRSSFRLHTNDFNAILYYRGGKNNIDAALCVCLYLSQEEMELAAAIKLQCWYRSIVSRIYLGWLASTKTLREMHELAAAKTIQQVRFARDWLSRLYFLSHDALIIMCSFRERLWC